MFWIGLIVGLVVGVVIGFAGMFVLVRSVATLPW